MALPSGQEDLPIISILKPKAWGILKDSILPDAMFDLFGKLTDFELKSRKV